MANKIRNSSALPPFPFVLPPPPWPFILSGVCCGDSRKRGIKIKGLLPRKKYVRGKRRREFIFRPVAPPTCAAPLALCSERRCTYGAFQLPSHLKFGIALSYIERERGGMTGGGLAGRFGRNEGFAELTIKAREKVWTS